MTPEEETLQLSSLSVESPSVFQRWTEGHGGGLKQFATSLLRRSIFIFIHVIYHIYPYSYLCSCKNCQTLAGPKPLAPNPLALVPNQKPRGLGLTLKSYRPPPQPTTLNHQDFGNWTLFYGLQISSILHSILYGLLINNILKYCKSNLRAVLEHSQSSHFKYKMGKFIFKCH